VPEFVKLIHDLTVEKNETNNARRKLVCAEDERPIARTSGTVATAIMAAMLAVFLMFDLTKVVRFVNNWIAEMSFDRSYDKIPIQLRRRSRRVDSVC